MRTWEEFEAEQARTQQAETDPQTSTRRRIDEYRAEQAAEEAAAAAEDQAVTAFLGTTAEEWKSQMPVRVPGNSQGMWQPGDRGSEALHRVPERAGGAHRSEPGTGSR
ncbi:hypothetical protein [Streptomyces murinus]|uniref:hypothetical protein n=1 Tax=Streptomyces murinus TaxID=33900 RepID=UPI00382D983B